MIIKAGTRISLENVSEHQVISFIKDALVKYPEGKELGIELSNAFDRLINEKSNTINNLEEQIMKKDKALEKWKFIKPKLTSKQKDELIDSF